MNIDFLQKGIFGPAICGVIVACCFSGCARHDYKQEADEQVYGIIDSKWRDGFGARANYRISDVAPSPNDILVEKSVPVSGVLGLPEAVALATAHNRDYQSQKDELYLKALDLTLARHEFENQFFSGAAGRYAREGGDEGIGAGADIGFDRLLAGGARISTSVAASWASILTGDLRSGLASIFSATITQPLLRGAGRAVVRENLTQAERDALYQIRSFNRFRKMFVVSVITQYYRVLQLSDAVGNTKEYYNALCQLYGTTEKLANAGRIPMFELERVRQDKFQAWDVYLQAQKQYQQALDEFKVTLNLPPTAEFVLDDTELAALAAAMEKRPQFSEAEAVETALAGRLDLANSADAVVDAERKVVVAANALKADLNLFAAVRPVSSERADVSLLKRWQDVFEAGAELNLPLDRVEQRNLFRKAMITLSQRQREHELAMDTVMLEVRQAYRDLTEALQRYKVQLDNLDLARKRFNETSLLLQYGRASSRRVLSARQDLFDAANAATQALVDYTVANLNFYRDTGVLQVRSDGMWALESD